MATDLHTPERILRDRGIKAVIWKNDGEHGPIYNVQFFRTYKDSDDQWHDVNRFTGTELLQVARLANQAYDAIDEMRIADAQDVG